MKRKLTRPKAKTGSGSTHKKSRIHLDACTTPEATKTEGNTELQRQTEQIVSLMQTNGDIPNELLHGEALSRLLNALIPDSCPTTAKNQQTTEQRLALILRLSKLTAQLQIKMASVPNLMNAIIELALSPASKNQIHSTYILSILGQNNHVARQLGETTRLGIAIQGSLLRALQSAPHADELTAIYNLSLLRNIIKQTQTPRQLNPILKKALSLIDPLFAPLTLNTTRPELTCESLFFLATLFKKEPIALTPHQIDILIHHVDEDNSIRQRAALYCLKYTIALSLQQTCRIVRRHSKLHLNLAHCVLYCQPIPAITACIILLQLIKHHHALTKKLPWNVIQSILANQTLIQKHSTKAVCAAINPTLNFLKTLPRDQVSALNLYQRRPLIPPRLDFSCIAEEEEKEDALSPVQNVDAKTLILRAFNFSQ